VTNLKIHSISYANESRKRVMPGRISTGNDGDLNMVREIN
jgi:hypothetical protein